MSKSLREAADAVASKVIEVVEFDTGNVVKTLGPMPESKAEKCDSGMQHNLDHDRFYTRIVDARDFLARMKGGGE